MAKINIEMDCASDYNVDGSLLGLGEFILLEILTEMEIPQDAQQFVILCRKTFKLLIHPRYARIIQSISIGIADASCSFAAGNWPTDQGNREKTARYYSNGDLSHISNNIKGNQKFEDGQRVAVEVDMTIVPRKATFFVDDIEQPNFVIGFPAAIRFWTYTLNRSSSFSVIKFERLIKSTSKGKRPSASKLLEDKFMSCAKGEDLLLKEILRWIITDEEVIQLQQQTLRRLNKATISTLKQSPRTKIGVTTLQQGQTTRQTHDGVIQGSSEGASSQQQQQQQPVEQQIHEVSGFDVICVKIEGA
ncbi:MAG: hypothetical protein EZS28_030816 [Streblomastix strix]|uniref:Uncharacterized protein n=1 Tax=Streblomastix strix TaxID=222440 RepID=A0A5J4UTG4_9EUKA|nr:MAG: hypothetical protein EZS28_030816 [Streblomastix strix]